MKKLFLLILSCILLQEFTLAQSNQLTQNDIDKYTLLRERLKTEFLKMGELDPLENCEAINETEMDTRPNGKRYKKGIGIGGYSIPAFLKDRPISVGSETLSQMIWGDGTSYLGLYIAVLASEYHLLKKYGKPTEATAEELYYALKAYERLDILGEILFPKDNPPLNCGDVGLPQQVNGYFVRDDVGEKFIDKYFKGKQDLYQTDFKDSDKAQRTADQIAELYLGFAMVKHLLETNDNYNGFNFVSKVKGYTHQIAKALEEDGWYGYTYGTSTLEEHGHIYQEGGDAVGIADAAHFITGNTYNDNITELSRGLWACKMTKAVDFFGGENEFTRCYNMALAAIGDSWNVGLDAVHHENCIKLGGIFRRILGRTVEICYTYTKYKLRIPGLFGVSCLADVSALPVVNWLIGIPLLGEWPDITVPVTPTTLGRRGHLMNAEIYPMLYKVFHGRNPSQLKHRYLCLIKSMPCEGPFFKPIDKPNDIGPNHWRGEIRYNKPSDSENGGGQGRFSALDWMMLYNTFWILYGDEFKTPNLEYDLSTTKTICPTILNDPLYSATFNLHLCGQVPNNATVLAEAGKEIVLKPGFNTDLGADFTAQININTLGCTDTQYESCPGHIEEIKRASLEQEQASYNNILSDLGINQNDVYTPIHEYLGVNEEDITLFESSAEVNDSDEDTFNLTLSPNPVSSIVTISFTLTQAETINLYLLNPQTGETTQIILNGVSLLAGQHSYQVDLSNYQTGVYTVILQTSNGEMVDESLIKQ